MQENLACACMPLINAHVVKSSRVRGIIHILCMQAVKALLSLSICTDSPGPSLLDDAICTKILFAGPNAFSNWKSVLLLLCLYTVIDC